MRIHLITNLFAPDELAGAALFSDLALYFRERGHDIRVTCTFPYYPGWKLRSEDVGVALREESFEGIPLRRVRMFVPEQPTGGTRMLSDASFLVSLLRRGCFPGWLPEVVVTASPMFSQCLAQRFLYPGKRIPRLIVVQDFVVDAALELGILRFPGLPPVLRGLERWAFRSAACLSTISPQMLQKLRGVVGEDRRTVCIPNWIHGSLADEAERQRRTSGARQRDLLFYSGNVGMKQGLPDFLEAFRKHESGWKVRIHGGGADVVRLKESIRPQDRVELGPVLDESAYVRELLGATACLVTQRPGVGANFLPSKLLPALATGTPVLAVCEGSSPLGQEVKQGGYGDVVPSGDGAQLAATLAAWAAEPERLIRYGERALERGRCFARGTLLAQYETELSFLLESRTGKTR